MSVELEDVIRGNEEFFDEEEIEHELERSTSQEQRLFIGMFFEQVHKAEEDESKWRGRGGIQAHVRQTLELDKRMPLDNIFKDVIICKKNKQKYDGARRLRTKASFGPLFNCTPKK